MKRIAIAVALVGCHHSGGPAGGGSGSGSGITLRVKQIQLAWGLQGSGANTTVFLQSTDETGSVVSHPLGSFPGACNVIDGAPMKALTSVMCGAAGTGTELDVTAHGDTVIIMRGHVDAGTALDPMSREELTRFDAPPGSAIGVKP